MSRLNGARRGASAGVLKASFLPMAWLLLAIAALAACYFVRPAQAQIAVRNQGYIPYSDAPIFYRTRDPADPVALLQKQIDEGKANLTFDGDSGYLKSVLDLLKIPVSSQTLVFSKTSFQFPFITAEHPRALYYNDDVYVGWVHQGKALELISFDPMQGAMFYILDERKADKPVFQRAELDCTQCHIARETRGVPGVFLRSVFPAQDGSTAPRTTQFVTDQKSPMKERWGGWYVSGGPAGASLAGGSMANATVAPGPVGEATPVSSTSAAATPQLTALPQPYNAAAYLTPESDQVSLLVLAHQTQMHNLVTLVNYQTRLALHALARDANANTDPAAIETSQVALDALPESARQQIKAPSEQLLRYLLFATETPLGGLDAKKVIAASSFAREFAAGGARDSKQRSLRDFDLHDRIFRYPCSYLIYNPAFDTIPQPAKGYIYHRLLEVLTGEDQSPDFAHLSVQDREAILSILLETKPGLPAEWQDYARSKRLRLAEAPGAVRNP
jgi:hypothetical protein